MECAYTTVCELLQDRGYSFIKLPFSHKDHLEIDDIKVFFIEEPKIGINIIKKLQEECTSVNIEKAILVCSGVLTSFAKQIVESEIEIKFDVFHVGELAINKTKHSLVPRHILLSENEKSSLLKILKLKASNLPRISIKDPIAKYYGGQIGSVFKIIRESENTGVSIYYRIVA